MRCTCLRSRCTLMTRLPKWWVSDGEGNHRQRRIWLASRFLTTKMPSAPLVAVVWLQHTQCPRFRRGTFGYGITTSPTREAEYEYGVFMQMHVSIPKLPKCICYATHTQKVTLILIHKVVSKTKRISFRTEDSIGSLIGTKFSNHKTWLITTSINNALRTLLLKEMFNPDVTSVMFFGITKQRLGLHCRLAAQQGS
jgi:hypothetical protein